MVDVGDKQATRREAVASGRILMQPQTLKLLTEGALPKGDVIATARIAGIQAAKRTHELIPLCHSLALSKVAIDFEGIQARIVGLPVAEGNYGSLQVAGDGDALDAPSGGPLARPGHAVADGGGGQIPHADPDPTLRVGGERVDVRAGVGEDAPPGAGVSVARGPVLAVGDGRDCLAAVSAVGRAHTFVWSRGATTVGQPDERAGIAGGVSALPGGKDRYRLRPN